MDGGRKERRDKNKRDIEKEITQSDRFGPKSGALRRPIKNTTDDDFFGLDDVDPRYSQATERG